LRRCRRSPPLAKTGCHRRADLTHLALALDFGLHRTALAYCVATAAFVAVAVGSLMLRRRGPATGPEH